MKLTFFKTTSGGLIGHSCSLVVPDTFLADLGLRRLCGCTGAAWGKFKPSAWYVWDTATATIDAKCPHCGGFPWYEIPEKYWPDLEAGRVPAYMSEAKAGEAPISAAPTAEDPDDLLEGWLPERYIMRKYLKQVYHRELEKMEGTRLFWMTLEDPSKVLHSPPEKLIGADRYTVQQILDIAFTGDIALHSDFVAEGELCSCGRLKDHKDYDHRKGKIVDACPTCDLYNEEH